jgi:hypothetical protein
MASQPKLEGKKGKVQVGLNARTVCGAKCEKRRDGKERPRKKERPVVTGKVNQVREVGS